MIKRIIADQATKGLAAQLAKLGFVDFLEQRALVPFGTGIAAQFLVQFGFGHVHYLNFQRRIGFRIVDRIGQTAPTAFQLLILGVVNDFVHLR